MNIIKKISFKSISSKIVASIAIVSFAITLIIFSVSKQITQETFYNVEFEKANLIAQTIEPLIALNIYLGTYNNIAQLLEQVMENRYILSVEILDENKIIINKVGSNLNTQNNEPFIVEKTIYQPNSKKQIGTLVIVYSNKGYVEIVNKYINLTFLLLLTLVILFIFFGFYVKKLLYPLRKIARLLKYYSPDKEIKIPYSSQNNEIGLISNALNSMQQKISQYAKKQKNINSYLEEKIDEKTMELRKQLYMDSLTGLPNRFSMFNDIVEMGADDGALLIINIDDFREINDFFGHIAGDNILKKFSNRLKTMFKKYEYIKLKRLSGDEFALLFVKKPPLKDFIKIAERLILSVEKMIFFHENNEISIRVTIGGAYQIHQALEKADIALKSAKREQKPFLLYDEKLNIEGQYKENMEWVKKLKKAIEQDMIVPYFQPIFDNKSDRIASYECLIRLIDNDKNVVSPYQFLTIAKKSRLYSILTKIMIQKSCAYFEHIDCDFSINLSVDDILSIEIVNYIKQKINEHNVAHKIIFEILESEGIENYEEVSLFTNDMKSLGCRIAIDDFGSGYSNFEHLLKLNIDYIKIDATLIKNIDKDTNTQIVVKTIVDFAKRLNILTVAEFVYNEEVYKKIKELGINKSQGFFLGKPEENIDNSVCIKHSE